jgi:hypothetical protein
MAVEDFMTETVTVLRPTGFTQSPSGEPTPTFESATTVMYLEPRQDTRRSTEAIEVGYVPLGDWLGVGRWDFDFGSWQQIVWNDKVFDILAPPRVIPNPRLGTLSHTELDLQTVGGPGVDATATPGTVGGVGG